MLQDTIRSAFVSLIPHSGIQFLDLGFNIDEVKFSTIYRLKEGSGGHRLLRTLLDQDNGKVIDSDGHVVKEEDQLALNLSQMLRVYDRAWLPLPLLRIKEESKFGSITLDKGPLNWARFRITALESPDKAGNSHRITLVVDTNLLPFYPSRPYAAPSEADVTSAAQFTLAKTMEDLEFLQLTDWSASMIDDAYDQYLVNRYGVERSELAKKELPPLTPWSNYLGLLDLFNELKIVPRIHFVDTVSVPSQYTPISVDLVLDVGNSRTCGILIEAAENDDIDLNNSYSLELRDLSEAERIYNEPFPSVIEFHRESFGNNRLTARSRGDAFQWPTPARVGWEANRLFNASHNTDGRTGISSPKRYLWDTREQNHDWYFNAFGGHSHSPNRVPAIKGRFFQNLTNSGDEWDKEDPSSACVTRATYTKSSMMMFYLSEVFAQAFIQINAYSQRRKKSYTNIPRRLNRIVLTMPTAMALSERKIFEKRAHLALKNVIEVMKIPEDEAPRLVMKWDEATGTQAVFLYNEIKENYRGDISQFFSSSARPRQTAHRSDIRIASLDIGGGTSDLIISTYQLAEGNLIKPKQEFREGFNIAGDDILCAIIEDHILPTIRTAVERAGVSEPDALMTTLFGASRANEDEREHLKRRLFSNQIFMPIGLRIIGLYEHYDATQGSSSYTLKFDDIFDAASEPSESVLAYLQRGVESFGGRPFDLQEVEFNIHLDAVDNSVKKTIGPVLKDLCELIHHYACDYLLLSGRPSMMPGVRDSVVSKMPIPVDRIISMHEYKVGSWYPYRDLKGRLSDPKTTAAVGAMVCALSNGYLIGFNLQSDAFSMKSTANYIGRMEDTGQIKNKNLYFSEINLDNVHNKESTASQNDYVSTEILFSGPMFIGFRHLNVERWPGTLLYRVDFNDRESVGRLHLPLKITLGLIPEEQDKQCKLFDVEMVEDAQGIPKSPSMVKFRLQTMRNDNGYWMDTGVFVI